MNSRSHNNGRSAVHSLGRARRIGPLLASGLLGGVALLSGCGAAASAHPQSLDKATTCTQATQENTKLQQTLSSLGNDTSVVVVVTKLDPIQGSFKHLATSTSDANLSGFLKSESSAVNSLETNSSNTDTVTNQLTTAIDGINAECSTTSQASTGSTAAPATTAPASTTTNVPATTTGKVVACNLFDIGKLNGATGLTWTKATGENESACVVTASDSSVITANLSATGGSTDGALSGAKSACTAGTYVVQQIADGGYTCSIAGVPSGGAVYAADNTLVAVSAISFSGADTAHVQAALVALLNSFIAN